MRKFGGAEGNRGLPGPQRGIPGSRSRGTPHETVQQKADLTQEFAGAAHAVMVGHCLSLQVRMPQRATFWIQSIGTGPASGIGNWTGCRGRGGAGNHACLFPSATPAPEAPQITQGPGQLAAPALKNKVRSPVISNRPETSTIPARFRTFAKSAQGGFGRVSRGPEPRQDGQPEVCWLPPASCPQYAMTDIIRESCIQEG